MFRVRKFSTSAGLLIAAISTTLVVSTMATVPAGAGVIVTPGGGIIVDTPRNDPTTVIQDFTSGFSWDPIEVQVRQAVAELHGVPNDDRIKWWARDEVRAGLFGRLITIARKDPASRTAAEQAAHQQFSGLVNQINTGIAQHAVDMYNSWANNPCVFRPPTGFPYTVPPQNCVFDPGLSPTPPTAEDFATWATYKVLGQRLNDGEARRVMRQMTIGLSFLAAMITAGLAAGAAAAIAMGSGAVALGILTAIAPAAVTAAGGSAAFLGATVPAVAGGVAAGIIAGIVAFIIIAIVGSVFRGIQVFTDAQVPIDLNNALTDATTNGVNIAAAADPYAAGLTEAQKNLRLRTLFIMNAAFVGETLPDFDGKDYLGTIGGPVVGAYDAQVDPVWGTQATGPEHQTSTITLEVWDNPDVPTSFHLENVYIHDGWFVRQRVDGGPKFYSLQLPYLNFDGDQKIAWIRNGQGFVITGLDPNGFENVSTLCAANPGCNMTNMLQVRGYDYSQGGPWSTVDLTVFLFNSSAPIVSMSPVPTGLVEGTPFALHANGTDADEDVLTYVWRIQKPGQFIGLDGIVRNNYEVYTGAHPIVTSPENGTWAVSVTAIDPSGKRDTESSSIVVANAPPALTNLAFDDSEGNEPFETTISGIMADPGEDQLGITVSWGDGSTSQQTYPTCSFNGGCDVTTPATDGAPFEFTHHYANDPVEFPDVYPVSVTVTDFEAGGTVVYQPGGVTVNNVPPTTLLNYQLGPFQIPIGDVRVVPAGGTTPVEVRALITDPGPETGSVTVNWGDGNIESYPYPCATTAGCTSQDVLVSCGGNPVLCPGDKIKLTHVYSAAIPGGSERNISVLAVDNDGGVGIIRFAKAYIRAATQTITFAPLADKPLGTAPFALTATSQSGLPVSYQASGPCTVAGATLTLTGAGQCTVTAFQPGNNLAWPAATPVARSFYVTTPLTVHGPTRTLAFGEPTGTLAPDFVGLANGDTPAAVTGTTCTTSHTAASVPGTYATACQGATAPPYYVVGYQPGTLTVTRAQTATTVKVVNGTTARATVAVIAPGAGTPTGQVTFSLDGASLGSVPVQHDGTASFPVTMPDGEAVVSVVYAGDSLFSGSTGSTAKKNPTIVASVAGTRAASGWYGSAAVISFLCTPGSAPLIQPCPAPVTLGEGRGQQAVGSVVAEDGGRASVTAAGIDVDLTGPTVAVEGVRDGETFSGPPIDPFTCGTTDALSGPDGACAVRVRRISAGKAPTYRSTWEFTATGRDRAGNVTTREGTYRVGAFYIAGKLADARGAVPIKVGKRYSLRAAIGGKAAPRLYLPVPAGPRRQAVPTKAGPLFEKASSVWSRDLRLTADQARISRYWNVGIRLDGEKLTRIVTLDLGRSSTRPGQVSASPERTAYAVASALLRTPSLR